MLIGGQADLGSGEVGIGIFYGLRHVCALLLGGGAKVKRSSNQASFDPAILAILAPSA